MIIYIEIIYYNCYHKSYMTSNNKYFLFKCQDRYFNNINI